jgi:hypothetical protein
MIKQGVAYTCDSKCPCCLLALTYPYTLSHASCLLQNPRIFLLGLEWQLFFQSSCLLQIPCKICWYWHGFSLGWEEGEATKFCRLLDRHQTGAATLSHVLPILGTVG